MRVDVLGSSGTYAAAGGACSGYLVRTDEATVLVDAGPGVLGRLQELVGLGDLDAVLLSHSHPDHWGEAPVLRNALRHVLHVSGLPVFGTAETLDMIAGVCHSTISPTFDTRVVTDGDEIDVRDLHVRFSRTDHPPETLAMRIDDGRSSLGYSADSGPGWGFAKLGAPVDLALCEATYGAGSADEPGPPVHMNASEAGAMVRRDGVGSLVLVHLLPGVDEHEARTAAADTFGGDVAVARSGSVYEL